MGKLYQLSAHIAWNVRLGRWTSERWLAQGPLLARAVPGHGQRHFQVPSHTHGTFYMPVGTMPPSVRVPVERRAHVPTSTRPPCTRGSPS